MGNHLINKKIMFAKLLISLYMVASVAADTMDNYSADDLVVDSITGGDKGAKYSKIVILLHGGGMNSGMWIAAYRDVWFGADITGYKFVMPTSAREDHTSYQDYKL